MALSLRKAESLVNGIYTGQNSLAVLLQGKAPPLECHDEGSQ